MGSDTFASLQSVSLLESGGALMLMVVGEPENQRLIQLCSTPGELYIKCVLASAENKATQIHQIFELGFFSSKAVVGE